MELRFRNLVAIAVDAGAVSLNQGLFAIAGLSTTAALSRSLPLHDSGVIFAVYAVESVAVVLLRAFTVQAPLLRHRSARLCARDIQGAFRRTHTVASAFGSSSVLLAWGLGLELELAACVGAWVFGLVQIDSNRSQILAFGSVKVASVLTAVFMSLAFAASVFVSVLGVEALLLLNFAASIVLSHVLRRQLFGCAEPGDCDFWARESGFAWGQAFEALGQAGLVALTSVVLGARTPKVMVALQISNQAVTAPALLANNGIGLVMTKQAVARQRAGRSDVAPLAAWILSINSLLLVAVVATRLLSEIFGSAFGEGWHVAAQILPFFAIHTGVMASMRVMLIHFRPRIRAARVARAYIIALGVGQAIWAMFALVGGFGDLGIGFVLASVWYAIYWAFALPFLLCSGDRLDVH